jgi:UPF0716 protein FxsA
MIKLFLLFTVIPAAEFWLLFKVYKAIDLFATIWLILMTGIIGAAMAKREGFLVIRDLKVSLQKGLPPGLQITEGILVLIGGLLLITPGIMTDLFGFSLILPFTRRRLAPLVQKLAEQKLKDGKGVTFGAMRAGPAMREQQNEGTISVEDNQESKNVPEEIFKHPTF